MYVMGLFSRIILCDKPINNGLDKIYILFKEVDTYEARKS